jgi:large subunit ribosomal protein L35
LLSEETMPKQKTHKGLAKRVKISARGKVKRKRAFRGHLLSGRRAKRKRRLRRPAGLSKGDAKRVIAALSS